MLSQIFWLGLRIIAGDTMVSFSIYSRKECCWGQAKEREIFQIYQNKVKFLDLKGDRVNRPVYRYAGHFELIRFKEYYGMLRGHEHDPIY